MLPAPKLSRCEFRFTSSGETVLPRNGIQRAARIARGRGAVDVVFQAGVPGLSARSIYLCAPGIGQHASAIREIENVPVLRDVVDQRAADATGARQPSLEVAYVDFHGVHDAVGRAAVVALLGIARFAFSRIVEVDGIPVVHADALHCGFAVTVPGIESGLVEGNLRRFGFDAVPHPAGLYAASGAGTRLIRPAAVSVAIRRVLENQDRIRVDRVAA